MCCQSRRFHWGQIASPIMGAAAYLMAAILGISYQKVVSAAFAAAPIASTSSTSVGWRAFTLGIPAYVTPFLFVANPELLGQGEWIELFEVLGRSAVAIVCLAIALTGWLGGCSMRWFARASMIIAAVLLITPSLLANIMALSLIGVV